MKKLQTLIVLLCCFSTTIYSLTINSEFHRTKYSETKLLIEEELFNSSIDNSILIAGTEDLRPKYRIGFNAPLIDHRQILLTIDENTTDGFDWGYDAEIYEIFNDDMYWLIDQKKYVIQATNTIVIGKEIPLGIITAGGDISIGIDALENPIDGIKVWLKDKELNKSFDIQESPYQITLPAGEYHTRYVLIFVSADAIPNDDTTGGDILPPPPGNDTTGDDTTGDDTTGDDLPQPPGDDTTGDDTTGDDTTEDDSAGDDTTGDDTTSDDDTENDGLDDTKIINHQFLMYVNNGSNTINIKNKQLVKLTNLVLYNKLGQVAQIWERNLNSERLSLPINVKRGIYFIQANTEIGKITKRIRINRI
tara:strand:+ start:29511 stop:30599 length:1089 start_codon:yes stop_codon:yes gene_type:complete